MRGASQGPSPKEPSSTAPVTRRSRKTCLSTRGTRLDRPGLEAIKRLVRNNSNRQILRASRPRRRQLATTTNAARHGFPWNRRLRPCLIEPAPTREPPPGDAACTSVVRTATMPWIECPKNRAWTRSPMNDPDRLTAVRLIDALRRDQAKRWDRGDQVLVESYLGRVRSAGCRGFSAISVVSR